MDKILSLHIADFTTYFCVFVNDEGSLDRIPITNKMYLLKNFFFRTSWIIVAEPNSEEDEKPVFERLQGIVISTAKENFYPTIVMIFAGALFVGLFYAVPSIQAGLIAYADFGTTNLGLGFPMITTGKYFNSLLMKMTTVI